MLFYNDIIHNWEIEKKREIVFTKDTEKIKIQKDNRFVLKIKRVNTKKLGGTQHKFEFRKLKKYSLFIKIA